MKSVTIKHMVIGRGMPKICVPVMGKDIDTIMQNALAAGKSEADMVEWRCDDYTDIFDHSQAIKALNVVSRNIDNKPLLCTFRSSREGGEQDITPQEYVELYKVLMETELVDLVDVELFMGYDTVNALIALAGEHNVKTIMSNHDFEKTPSDEEISDRLVKMQEFGADVAKIAVMPENRADVLRLMSVTRKIKDNTLDIPVITMSMGDYGMVSRMAGEISGSDVTFASVSGKSAPGQIDIGILKGILNTLHMERSDETMEFNIALIGFMGSGKTTISKRMSEKLNLEMIDIDKYIVDKNQMSINDMFDEYGEKYFRDRETEATCEIAGKTGKIISCGGGTVLRDVNVEALKKGGAIVLLKATPETIFNRVKNSKDRPILNGNMNVEFIEELMNKRKDRYEEVADITIDTDNKSVESIVVEIIEKIVEKYSIVL